MRGFALGVCAALAACGGNVDIESVRDAAQDTEDARDAGAGVPVDAPADVGPDAFAGCVADAGDGCPTLTAPSGIKITLSCETSHTPWAPHDAYGTCVIFCDYPDGVDLCHSLGGACTETAPQTRPICTKP